MRFHRLRLTVGLLLPGGGSLLAGRPLECALALLAVGWLLLLGLAELATLAPPPPPDLHASALGTVVGRGWNLPDRLALAPMPWLAGPQVQWSLGLALAVHLMAAMGAARVRSPGVPDPQVD